MCGELAAVTIVYSPPIEAPRYWDLCRIHFGVLLENEMIEVIEAMALSLPPVE